LNLQEYFNEVFVYDQIIWTTWILIHPYYILSQISQRERL
jgi:hypothetical protein